MSRKDNFRRVFWMWIVISDSLPIRPSFSGSASCKPELSLKWWASQFLMRIQFIVDHRLRESFGHKTTIFLQTLGTTKQVLITNQLIDKMSPCNWIQEGKWDTCLRLEKTWAKSFSRTEESTSKVSSLTETLTML